MFHTPDAVLHLVRTARVVKSKGMKLNYISDPTPVQGAALGLIVLDTDETIEPEMARYFAGTHHVLYHSRIPFHPEVTPKTLRAMAASIPASTDMFPTAADLAVIGYGCTSGATVIGPQSVAKLVQSKRQHVHVSDPISATLAAFEQLRAQKIGFLTPYVPDVSQAMQSLIETSGYQITAFGSFEEIEDAAVARINPASIVEGAKQIAQQSGFDTLFVSCTNLRAAGVIAEIEDSLGVNVVTSNQALAWHMQTLAGQQVRHDWAGALFR